MNNVIVNADDLGYNLNINNAIKYCIKNGFINKVSLMSNMYSFDDAIKICKEFNVTVGFHFNIVDESKYLLAKIKYGF
jgi:predicted glycoside hydrolase/deacetylase ChbG (UPF0249 family)